MNDELGNLVEPMVKEWTIDELDDWVRRYRLNNNLSIGLWQSVRGTLHITQEWAGGIQNATIGLDGDRQRDGTLRLTPYLNDAARASAAAIADLRRLRGALEAAGIMPVTFDPTALGTRAKQLGIITKRLKRWEKIRLHYYPKGWTWEEIAEEEDVSIVAIRNDFRDMRKHGLLPPAKKPLG